MAAICSLLSPHLVQNPKAGIRIAKPSARIPNATPCLISQSLEPYLSLSNPRMRTLGISAVTAEASVQDEVARRLYVGNIPRELDNDELAKMFGEHGSVEKAEVMYDKYSGRSRRFAFVTMNTVEDASAAIEKLNDTEIGGRKIKVNVTEKPLSGEASVAQSEESTFIDSPFKVYVGNLAKTVTTDLLCKFFSEKAKVISARVSRAPGTSKSSAGFGFVTFSSDEDVEAAISSFNNAFLEGQRVRVNKA